MAVQQSIKLTPILTNEHCRQPDILILKKIKYLFHSLVTFSFYLGIETFGLEGSEVHQQV